MHDIILLLRQYAVSSWRHRWKALALAWLVCLGGWAWVYTQPNQYRTSTRVFADADIILSQLLSGIAVDSRPQSQVDLLQRTLLSRPNLERISVRTGLDLRASTAGEREALLTALGSNVRIAAQTQNLFTITYIDPDPRMAHAVVQALLTMFMEQAAQNDRVQLENARGFINQQLAAYETQLRDAEHRRAEFRARYMDLLPGDGGGVTGLEAARGRVVQLRGEVQDAQLRRDMLRQQLETVPQALRMGEGGTADPRVQQAEAQLRELRLQFTEQHPAVIAARNALTELRAGGGAGRGGGATGPMVPNPLYEQVRVRLLDAEGQIATLERQLRQSEQQVTRLEALARTVPQLQAQYVAMDRDYAVLQRAFGDLLARRESLQIAGAARVGADRVRLEVVDPPLVPTQPIAPNRPLLAAGVLVAGLGAGAVLAFLFSQLDRSFYTVHDLRKLGLPVLGSISSTLPQRGQVIGMVVFAIGVGTLLAAFAAVTTAGPALMARLPSLVMRFMA